MKNLKLTLAKDVLKKDYKLFFVDIKSGEARLNKTQKQIKDIVENKKVSFKLY
ncbi:MAG: Holliday junction resolvase-like protein [Bacteroidota bacterium]